MNKISVKVIRPNKYLFVELLGSRCVSYLVRRKHNNDIFRQHTRFYNLWFLLQEDFHQYIRTYPSRVSQIPKEYIDYEMIFTALTETE